MNRAQHRRCRRLLALGRVAVAVMVGVVVVVGVVLRPDSECGGGRCWVSGTPGTRSRSSARDRDDGGRRE